MGTTSEKLRGVLVGAGYFSDFHLDAWRRIDEVQLAAICDLDLDRARQQSERFGIPRCYCDFAEMLEREQPSFVDIVTRPESHRALCCAAAARGIAVICQKPFAPSFAEARQLVDEVTRADVPLMVHDNFRFQPWHRAIKQLTQSGEIGDQLQAIAVRCRMGDGWQEDAYLGRQPYFRTMPRLLVYETAVHFIDTFRYLFGEVERVYAQLRRLNPAIAGEDTGCIILEFTSGAQGLITATRYHEALTDDPRYTFGDYVIDGNGGTIFTDLNGNLTVKRLGQSSCQHEYLHQNRGFAGDSVLPTQQHFVDQLLSHGEFETSGPEYLKTLAVQEAVYRSAETHTPVIVESP